MAAFMAGIQAFPGSLMAICSSQWIIDQFMTGPCRNGLKSKTTGLKSIGQLN